MKQGYFRQVAAQTSTRLWINNPTTEEVKKALYAGAIACTTNPTYSARMLRLPETREKALSIVDKSITEIPFIISHRFIVAAPPCHVRRCSRI